MQSLTIGTIPIIPDLEGRRVLVTGAELHQDIILTIESFSQVLSFIKKSFSTVIYGLEECMGLFATESPD